MTRKKWLALCMLVVACLIITQAAQATKTITFLGKSSNVNDFEDLGWGSVAYYFPQFDGEDHAGKEKTDDNMRFYRPGWIDFEFDFWDSDRTFSIDAGIVSWSPFIVGVYSRGGENHWDNSWVLPTGETGRSGCIIDEAAAGNSNNTVNRIHLGGATPDSFILRIVTDNTANTYDPAGLIMARGADDSDPEIDVRCSATGLSFDGNTDVYSFRYDNWEDDDFIKIRLNSGDGDMNPGFGGLMFDLP